MQTKKGFVITGVILAAITAASFTVWFLPQETPKVVISGPKQNLDALIEQQKAVADSTAEEFDRMLAGQITPDNYINIAEIASSQINSFIIASIENQVPQEWQTTYSTYTDFLRTYNSYLRETIVIANKIKGNSQADISQESDKLEEYIRQADELLITSNDARPQ
jgi:hypothetical protein